MTLYFLLLLLITAVAAAEEKCPEAVEDIRATEDVIHQGFGIGIYTVCIIVVALISIFVGYLVAGYHFYDQILHDIIDDEERKAREDRIQKIMNEHELLWQMKKARDDRKIKEAEKIPKMITVEEHEKEMNERKVQEQKLEDRVKVSERRVLELEAKLEKYKVKEKEKKKIQQIQVQKPQTKIPPGQKLLSGKAEPMTPGTRNTNPKAIALDSPNRRNFAVCKQPPSSSNLDISKQNNNEKSLNPNIGSIKEDKKLSPTLKQSKSQPLDRSKNASKTEKKGSKSSKESEASNDKE